MNVFEHSDDREDEQEPDCRHCGAPGHYVLLRQRGPWMELVCDICGNGECGIAF